MYEFTEVDRAEQERDDIRREIRTEERARATHEAARNILNDPTPDFAARLFRFMGDLNEARLLAMEKES